MTMQNSAAKDSSRTEYPKPDLMIIKHIEVIPAGYFASGTQFPTNNDISLSFPAKDSHRKQNVKGITRDVQLETK